MADKEQEQQKQQEQLKQAAESRRKADEEAKNVAAADVDARLSAKDQQVQENEAREAASRPTPTQRENDLARVGALDLDNKEDDGSEPEVEVQKRAMESRSGINNPYTTREMKSPDAKSAEGSGDDKRRSPRRGGKKS